MRSGALLQAGSGGSPIIFPKGSTMHWASPYIGQPWSKHGQGPETWNCWSFFRDVQLAHFGVETPAVPYADDLLVLARLFRDHQERGHWQPVTAYREGDGVMMRTARYPIHVGVWLEVDGGRVLHCAAGSGVVCQSRRDLAANGWRIDGIYRHRGAAS